MKTMSALKRMVVIASYGQPQFVMNHTSIVPAHAAKLASNVRMLGGLLDTTSAIVPGPIFHSSQSCSIAEKEESD